MAASRRFKDALTSAVASRACRAYVRTSGELGRHGWQVEVAAAGATVYAAAATAAACGAAAATCGAAAAACSASAGVCAAAVCTAALARRRHCPPGRVNLANVAKRDGQAQRRGKAGGKVELRHHA
eukprot:356602-Chlamydomonas_euryale.AAC.1